MKFNYNTELLKFKKWQKEQEQILRESGMSEESVSRIKEEDWKEFKAERTFCLHNISLNTVFIEEEKEDKEQGQHQDHLVFGKSYKDTHFRDCKEDWLANIEDQKLYKALESLDSDQLDLAYSVYECNLTLNDYAIREGVSLSAISQRHSIILKKIKKVYEMP